MKTRITFAAAMVFAFSMFATATYAQSSGEPLVKVIHTNQKGIIKVVYAHPTDNTVEIKFFDANQVILTDKIDSKVTQAGFIKKYDMRRLKGNNYTVQLSSPELTVTYRLEESKEKQTWIPVLSSTTYNHALVAKN